MPETPKRYLLNLETKKAILEHPLTLPVAVALIAVVWSALTSEYGPMVFVLALFAAASTVGLRNQLRYRSEFEELKNLVQTPPEIRIEKEYVFLDPPGWQFLGNVQKRNQAEINRMLRTEGGFQVLSQLGSSPPRFVIIAPYWNLSIYDLRVRSVEGNVKFRARESGVIDDQIVINVVEKNMPNQINVLTDVIRAQTKVDVYIEVRIGFPSTVEGIKNLIQAAEAPVLELYDLSIILVAPDEESISLALAFGDFRTIYLKKS